MGEDPFGLNGFWGAGAPTAGQYGVIFGALLISQEITLPSTHFQVGCISVRLGLDQK